MKYIEVKAAVQRSLRVDKQRHIEQLCAEIDQDNKRGKQGSMFWTVKALTRKFKPKLHMIKTDRGEVITDPDKIAEILFRSVSRS